MKPPPFDYLQPESLDEALAVLAEHGDEACVLAGGQTLIAMLNMRLLSPRVVLDISGLAALDDIELHDGWLEIGATVTQATLARWPGLTQTVPLLALALPHVGHYQTRSRGTVCGSIAHSDPSSELPLCLNTLQGEVVLRSLAGERTVGADEFQQGLLVTARESSELIVAVRFPVARESDGYAFREFAIRHGDFALIATAVRADQKAIRFGIGGCGDRPAAVTWQRGDPAVLEERLGRFVDGLTMDDDAHASAQYRRQLAVALGVEALGEALQCAG